METAEIVVYLVITIIIGGLIIAFVAGMDTTRMYDAVRNVFIKDKEITYQKVTASDFPAVAFQLWTSCNHGLQGQEQVISLIADRENKGVNKTFMFQTYERLNLCYTIQSNSSNCGGREDVNFTSNIMPPAIIKLTCNNETRKLDIIEVD